MLRAGWMACFSIIIAAAFSGCSPGAPPTAETLPILCGSGMGRSGYLAVTAGEWETGRENALDVQVTSLSHPAILGVEVIPGFPDSTAWQPSLPGSTISAVPGEMLGYAVLRRVMGAGSFRIALPAAVFNDAWYDAVPGWKVRVTLSLRIDAYSIPKDGLSPVRENPITPDDVPDQPVGIGLAALGGCLGMPADRCLTVSSPRGEMLLYYPPDAVVDLAIVPIPASVSVGCPPPMPARVAVGLSREEDAAISPSHPAAVVVRVVGRAPLISWVGTGDDRVVEYRIYRRDQGGASPQLVGRVVVDDDNRGEYQFRAPGGPSENPQCPTGHFGE